MARLTARAISSVFLLLFAVSAHAQAEKPRTAPYPGDIVYRGTGQAVVFSHDFHVGGMGFTCDACHTEVFELKAYAARDKGNFKMSVMQDGEYCGKCHDGQTAFSSGDFASCGRCHAGAAEANEVPGLKVVGPEEDIMLGPEGMEARFPHPSHAVFPCDKCHTALFPMKKTDTVTSMDEINSGKSCGVCHNGAVAFDATNCGICHPGM